MNYNDAIIFKKKASNKAREIARKNGAVIHPRIQQRRLKMDFSNFKEEINKLEQEIKDIRKNMEEKSKALFNEKITEFFTAYPEIGAIGWNQYTPYFNDGDTCEFGRGDIYFVDAEQEDEDWLDDIGNDCHMEDLKFSYKTPSEPGNYAYANKHQPYWAETIKKYNDYIALGPSRKKDVCEACEALKSILETIPEDIYYDMFGDHAFVLITKNGVKVEEFKHD